MLWEKRPPSFKKGSKTWVRVHPDIDFFRCHQLEHYATNFKMPKEQIKARKPVKPLVLPRLKKVPPPPVLRPSELAPVLLANL